MKKVNKIFNKLPQHMTGAGIDKRTAQDIILMMNKIYNGNQNLTHVKISHH